MIKYFASLLILFGLSMSAQNDTIHLKNSDILVGEVKSFKTGILTIETDYSDEDFQVDYAKIAGISIQRRCIINLTEGRRRFGYIKTNTDGIATITLEDGTVEQFRSDEIIALQEVSNKFWSRFSGAIDFGLNITKANNDVQYTGSGQVGYRDKKWLFAGNLNTMRSQQDGTEKIERTDAALELLRVLPRKWFLQGKISFLANTEQAITGRISPNIGIGKFLISTNKLYLGLNLGYTYNIENYVDSSLNKSSSELTIGLDYNMFDFKDLDLKTGIDLFPSLSEQGRLRIDYDINLKYDLPLDFYVKLGYTLNYDNQPAEGTSEVDYVFTSGFGWKFD